MPRYETIIFENELDIPEGDEVVSANITPSGSRQRTNSQNVALVRRRENDYEGVECGYQLADGECGRTVDSPDDYCWQHEDNDE